LFGRPVEINVLFEPVKGEFHFKKLFRVNGLVAPISVRVFTDSTMLHADDIGFVTCCAEFSLRISGLPNRRWHRLYGFILTELVVAEFHFHFSNQRIV
jgi:hypothetical protein